MKRRVCMAFLVMSIWLGASVSSARALTAEKIPHPGMVVVAMNKG